MKDEEFEEDNQGAQPDMSNLNLSHMATGTPSDPVQLRGVQWFKRRLIERDEQVYNLRLANNEMENVLKSLKKVIEFVTKNFNY